MAKRVKDETIIRLLKIVRYRIENDGGGYICNEVSSVARRWRGYKEAAKYIKRWVNSMLEGEHSLNHWMCTWHPDVFECMEWYTTADGAAARIQWIDWMINEVERTKS